jgi:hypothetical protein
MQNFLTQYLRELVKKQYNQHILDFHLKYLQDIAFLPGEN